MSWPCKLLAVLALVVSSGCGFSPIHAKRDGALGTALSGVDVAPVAGREGQILTSHIEDLINPESLPSPTTHVLETSVSVNYIPVVIESDGTVSRYRIDISVPVSLRSAGNDSIVFSSLVRRSVSYNVSESDYTSYLSSTDMMERGVKDAANDVVMRISAFLVKP